MMEDGSGKMEELFHQSSTIFGKDKFLV